MNRPMTQNEFVYAVYTGDLPTVRAGIAEGRDPNQPNREGTPPLFFAIEAGHELVVELLLEAGADPHLSDATGRTAAHVAAFWNRVSMLEELDAIGVKIDYPAVDQQYAAPLHYAAQSGAAAAVQWLLAKGVHSDIKTISGETPAALARKKGHLKVASLLERAQHFDQSGEEACAD